MGGAFERAWRASPNVRLRQFLSAAEESAARNPASLALAHVRQATEIFDRWASATDVERRHASERGTCDLRPPRDRNGNVIAPPCGKGPDRGLLAVVLAGKKATPEQSAVDRGLSALRALAKSGVSLSLVGDSLHASPAGALTHADRALIANRRGEIIAALQGEPV